MARALKQDDNFYLELSPREAGRLRFLLGNCIAGSTGFNTPRTELETIGKVLATVGCPTSSFFSVASSAKSSYLLLDETQEGLDKCYKAIYG